MADLVSYLPWSTTLPSLTAHTYTVDDCEADRSQAPRGLSRTVLMSLDRVWREGTCLANDPSVGALAVPSSCLQVLDFGHCRGLLREPQSDQASRRPHLPLMLLFSENPTLPANFEDRAMVLGQVWDGTGLMTALPYRVYVSPGGLPCMASCSWLLLDFLPTTSQIS